ncbi:MAG: hypothetical protein FWH21_06375 [Kiritimatiellaeota bacterium]|nr:hypothetical protein [Kiritimatiellota bacterium]
MQISKHNRYPERAKPHRKAGGLAQWPAAQGAVAQAFESVSAERNACATFFVLALALAGMCLTGCVSSNVAVDRARNDLRCENYLAAQTWADGLKTSTFSKELGLLESGRVHMLAGDFEASVADFDRAIETVLTKSETGPVINLSDGAGNLAAATVTDDRTRIYRIPPYEFIQALNYQMWNYLFLGRPDAAMVEARRVVFAQDAMAEKYGPKVQEERTHLTSSNAGAMGAMDTRMEAMGPVLEKTRCSYENGLTWYFCGILFELDRDASNARLAYQKAWELTPGNPYIERDMLRLARSEAPETFNALMARSRLPAESLDRSPAEIVLVVEDNFVSQRRSVKVPLPLLGTSMTSVDFPMYNDDVYPAMPLNLSADAGTLGLLSPALFLQSLAYQDLKEKMPGIVVRNVTRVAGRIAAQQVVKHTGNSYAQLGVGLFNLASAIINKADTRAWYTLPMVAHVYRGNIEPGEYQLTLANQANGRTVTFPVSVAQGETRFVWVGDPAGRSRAVSASMNGKGAPATCTPIESLFN